MKHFSIFLCLLLLISIPNLGYTDQWLVGKDREPKEVHVGELIIIEGCRGEWCFRFCDKKMMVSIDYLPDGSVDEYWIRYLGKGGLISIRKMIDKFLYRNPSEEPIGLKTSRPFTLYSDLDGPTPTTKYGAGVIAKPIEQKIVIRDRGEYVVEEVRNPSKPPKVGDKVDTPIYVGEGSMIVRSNCRWIGFSGLDIDGCFRTGDCYDLKLNVIREAKVEIWVKVEVEGVVGFTPEGGFLQGCYE